MLKKVSKLLSIMLAVVLVLSLAATVLMDQPAQALTASEITAAQTAAATELADAQARADKAWNALTSLPAPEDVNGPEDLPDTCPYCGRTTTYKPTSNTNAQNRKILEWIVVEGGETSEPISVSSMNRSGHIYLKGDVTYTAKVSTESNAFITAGYDPAITCIFTNGYDIISQDAVAFFSTTYKMNVIAYDRNDRTKGSTIQGDGNETSVHAGATIHSNGGATAVECHLFGGTYEKYSERDSSNKANVIAAYDNSGRYFLYDGATVNAGTNGSAVYLNGNMNYGPAELHLYGGTLNGGGNDETVEIEASAGKAAVESKPTENPNLYCTVNMYGGTINGSGNYAALSTIDIQDGTTSTAAALYSARGKKDCRINIYGGEINAAATNRAIRVGTEATDLKIFGGTINGGEMAANTGSTVGSCIYNDGGKITVAGGQLIGGSAKNGGAIFSENSGTINIHGGTITGCDVGDGKGGALIANGADGVVNITGGTINGSTATYGGAIAITSGALNISGGTINGGTAANADATAGTGGALYLDNATTTISGGTITGGKAVVGGGNIYANSGTLTISGGTIQEGEVTITTNGGAGGGNVFTNITNLNISDNALITGGIVSGKSTGGNVRVTGGDVYITGGTISNGQGGTNGGNFYGTGSSDVYFSGGEMLGGTADSGGNVSLYNCKFELSGTAKITGGEAIAASGVGGALQCSGGATYTGLTITGGTISGGTAKSGGNVYISTGWTANMSGGTITGGIAHGGKNTDKSESYGGNLYLNECTFNMSGGTITKGESAGKNTAWGGNLYCTSSSTANITGGTISEGRAQTGGNVYAYKCTFTMSGGTLESGYASYYGGNLAGPYKGYTITLQTGATIKDGTAVTRGGNIYLNGGGTINYAGAVTLNGSSANGGSINVYQGTFNMTSGTIDGGVASVNGGNIQIGHLDGIANLQGGLIQNGLAEGNGGNVHIVNTNSVLNTSADIFNGVCRKGGGNIDGGSGHVIVNGGTIANGWVTGPWDEASQTYKAGGGNWGGNIRSWKGDVTINGGLIYGGVRGGDKKATHASNNVGCLTDSTTGYATLTINGGIIVGDVGTSNFSSTTLVLTGSPMIVKRYTLDNGTVVTATNGGLRINKTAAAMADISRLSANALICVSADGGEKFTKAFDGAEGLKRAIIPYLNNRCITVKDNQLVYTLHDTKNTVAATAATCETTGNIQYKKCATCGTIYDRYQAYYLTEAEYTIPALGHDYQAGAVTDPTCDAEGYTTYVCANDPTHTEQGDKVEALGHTAQTVSGYAATCTETGLTDGAVCAVCGETITAQEEIPAPGHKYTVETTPATCTADGKKVYTCACGDTNEETIPAGHQIQYVAAVVPANCKETGHDEYWKCDACGAYFGDADASYQINPAWINYTGEHVRPEGAVICAVVPCVICGEDSYGEPCDRGDAPECQNAPCVNCGETVWGWGCNYNTGDEEVQLPLCQPGDCVYCGQHYDKLYECENGSWAPCAYDGECAYGCGKQYPATGEHELDDPCAGGMCWLCWEEIEGAHTVVVDEAVAATCTATGLTEGSHCGVCGEVITAQETVNALGHDYKAETTPATCTADGKTVYTCENCGDTYEETIPAGHQIRYVAAVVPANCKETGHDEYWKCDACGAYFGDAEASYQINPAWINYTGEHVRPEGAVICAVVPCVICGEDSYGEPCDRGDAPVCQDTTCVNCGEFMWGWGCNYNTGDEEVQLPLCQPGDCAYCGTHYEKLYDCENGSWAPCAYDGECAYGCGKQYPATGEHELDDPCAGGMCWLCWEEIEGAHTVVVDEAVAPTCTATGLTEGAHCGLCGEVITAQAPVDALGHNYQLTGSVAPSCTENGEKTYTCSNCGDSYTEEITATGHNIVLLTPAQVPANCVTPGKAAVYTCTICECYFEDAEGKTEQDSETPNMIFPNGHELTYNAGYAATCVSDGAVAHYLCSVCGNAYATDDDYASETIETVIPALGHTAGEMVIENKVDATYNAPGSYDEVVYCSVCGEEISRETKEIPQLTGAVAVVGGVYYTTLAEAMEAAEAGQTVTLLKPIVVAAGETLELDLKGVTVAYESNVPGEDMITVRGNLIISDSVGGGKLTYANTDATANNVTVSTISAEPGSTVVINSGIVENKSVKASGSSIYPYAIDILTNGNLGDVTVTINGGTVYSDYMAIRQFNNGTACKNTLTVNGGHIYGASRAIQVHLKNNAAYTTISGGTIEAGGYSLCLYPTDATNIAITGGTFIGDVYSGTNGIISGGNFDRELYEGYCAEGYVPAENENGTYDIVEDSNVAKIGDVKYETVEAALAAAQPGDTIVMIADSDESDAILLMMNGVKLDLNGKTLKALYVITTTGGSEIIDATNGNGIIIMAKNNLTLVNPACLPVWNAEVGGYHFVKVEVDIYEATKTAAQLKLMYWFTGAFDEHMKHHLTKVAENGLKVVLRVDYTYANGAAASLDIVLPDKIVLDYAGITDDDPYFETTIRGLNSLGDAKITVCVTYGDIVIPGATYEYTAVAE